MADADARLHGLFSHLPGGLKQFQDMISEHVGGRHIFDDFSDMTADEVSEFMPPFPFPRELFPSGFFRPGMRFSCDGLDNLPRTWIAETSDDVRRRVFPSAFEGSIVQVKTAAVDAKLDARSSWTRTLRRSLTPSRLLRFGSRRSSRQRPDNQVPLVQPLPQVETTAAPTVAPTASLSAAPTEARVPALERSGTSVASFGSRLLTVPDADDGDPRWRGLDVAPLHRAAAKGDVSALSALIAVGEGGDAQAQGALLDALDGGETALHLAAERGHTEAIAWLLARGSSVQVKNADGWTPLHSAAQGERSAEVVAMLLRHKADVAAVTAKGVTPLHVCAFNGQLAAAKALLAAGAPLQVYDANGYSPLQNARHWLEEKCACSVEEDEKRHWGAMVALLEKVSPMEAAERVDFARRTWRLHVGAALVDASERPASATPTPLPPPPTFMDTAADEGGGRSSDLERLLAPPTFMDTAVDEGGGRPSDLERLLACYADDIDARDVDGATALHAAAAAGHATAMALLLEHGASVSVTNNYEDTPLHAAAREGHADVVRALLAHRADPHATNRFGARPLDVAERSRGGDARDATCEALRHAAAARSIKDCGPVR